ncbi:hypothetical protein RUM43_012280 [Polyplax serrata]|uniref:Uncharacterized protein n=1 Tax=Polyplax serrata TaxID=468196 RepID=A0AAN8PTL1_POLSC
MKSTGVQVTAHFFSTLYINTSKGVDKRRSAGGGHDDGDDDENENDIPGLRKEKKNSYNEKRNYPLFSKKVDWNSVRAVGSPSEKMLARRKAAENHSLELVLEVAEDPYR